MNTQPTPTQVAQLTALIATRSEQLGPEAGITDTDWLTSSTGVITGAVIEIDNDLWGVHKERYLFLGGELIPE